MKKVLIVSCFIDIIEKSRPYLEGKLFGMPANLMDSPEGEWIPAEQSGSLALKRKWILKKG